MKMRSVLSFLMLILPAVPQKLAAQTGTVSADITVKVPINLTQLGPEITKIRVSCAISSAAILNAPSNGVIRNQELPVSGGQVVATASIAYSFTGLDNPAGKQGQIGCWVEGYSSALAQWADFSPTATNPSFKVNVQMASTTPFTW